ncbi:hypothetical protein F2Q68_00031253 [Brassica cretica]|uniref:Uncharacterized protein n=1 Tax=Brassica cretica TaxID=69181 RepID=A0A8S9G6J4_BRACR|nr:hypothetical protein F2Q68_00031253 [Brassica cretica]
MRGGTSCSTWLAACPGHMHEATTPPRCQAARLELMQGATGAHTCRSTCFSCMRGDTSFLVDPPRAYTCQAACTASMQGDSSSFWRHSACYMVVVVVLAPFRTFVGRYGGQHVRYGRGDRMGRYGRSDQHDPMGKMVGMDGMIRWDDMGSMFSTI